jgi:hypothetical protein
MGIYRIGLGTIPVRLIFCTKLEGSTPSPTPEEEFQPPRIG